MIALVLLAHLLYSPDCCNDRDCHPIPCEQVQRTKDGWLWWGYLFDRGQLRASPDGNCHVCVWGYATFCIYLPETIS